MPKTKKRASQPRGKTINVDFIDESTGHVFERGKWKVEHWDFLNRLAEALGWTTGRVMSHLIDQESFRRKRGEVVAAMRAEAVRRAA